MKVNYPLLLNLIFFALPLYSQKDAEDIVIGKYRIIQSEILNEERRILVHLPVHTVNSVLVLYQPLK
jgi:hypothetical protein